MMTNLTRRIVSTTLILSVIFMAGLLLGRRTMAAAPLCETAQCEALEADILAATVRIELEVWKIREDESGFDIEEETAHGTLVEGRYLVTHNHFELMEHAGSTESSMRVVLMDSEGRTLLTAPMTDFHVTASGEEMLVFEMKYGYMARRLLESGARFAEMRGWRELRLEPGAVVAQVNWDGESTRVQWTWIEEVVLVQGTPQLRLADPIGRGSSGGGVFWNGVHIANNWKAVHYADAFGNPAFTTSVAALNEGLTGTGEVLP